MKTVLFICTGNTCRSPMAQGLFQDLIKGRHDIEVTSAGVGAMHGQPATPYAVEVMEDIGIDISHIRSKPVVADLVRRADFIFVMTYGHLDSMLLLFPMAGDKTFLLREFETDLPVMEREVPDPVGHPREAYEICRNQIHKALPRLLDLVLRSTASVSVGSSSRLVCVGADRDGDALKEAVQMWLVQNHYPMEDFGTVESEKEDIAVCAEKVARAVSNRTAEFGILLGGTGQGMSMFANKIQGVRAALVRDVESARLSREKYDANILCLPAYDIKPKRVKEILEAWFNTAYIGEKHQRIEMDMETKLDNTPAKNKSSLEALAKSDPEIFKAISHEEKRQHENIELIASENFTSRAVMEAQGSCLTNKYAEGYPGKRWYGGCENVDVVEQLAIDRAKELFGAEHANVQPHSGAQANMAVYFAMLQPGDTIFAMELSQGGHLTHGHPKNFSGRFFTVIPYGVSRETEQIDYNQLAESALEHKPKMIVAGATVYSRIIDFRRMREIADSVDAYLFVDMAHIAGLVAAGVHPSPIPYADFVTTTTHKTLRGPRGGLILCTEKYAKEIDAQVFPGIQGGPLMHVIAGKAVCFGEALRPEFKSYQHQIVRNAKALCEGMKKNGYRIVAGTTENHLMLVDLSGQQINGKEAQETLDQAGITVNKNTIPFDTQSPFKGSGIRLGTPAVTTRGMKEDEMFDIATFIHEALTHRHDVAHLKKIQHRVAEFTSRFPLPY